MDNSGNKTLQGIAYVGLIGGGVIFLILMAYNNNATEVDPAASFVWGAIAGYIFSLGGSALLLALASWHIAEAIRHQTSILKKRPATPKAETKTGRIPNLDQ